MHIDLRETHIIGNLTRERIITRSQVPMMRDVGMIMAGISLAKPDFRFVRHQPGIFQFLACLSAEGEVLVDNQWRQCGENHAYLTPAKAPHAYRATGSKTWEVCWAMYDHTHWLDYLDLQKPICCQIQTQPIHSAIACLHHETMGPADAMVMRQWVLLIDQLIQRACKTWQKPSKLWQLWQQVDMDPGHPWHIDELSEMAQMSNEHLRRLCQNELGIAPMGHVAKLRMQRAAYLLGTTLMPVAQIATLVGYDNAFAFTTAFKRHLHKSPTNYRKTHKK